MALTKKGKYLYGDSQQDIRTYLSEYSADGYPVAQFADARCICGNTTFRLSVDDAEGVAVRTCTKCGLEHAIGDSAEYLEDAELEEAECPCGSKTFEITVGVALYEGSEDVRWLYLGCGCVECSVVGCWGDWKNEYIGYRELLSKI